MDNYADHILNHGKAAFGITEPCVFHKINGFHVTSNLAVDVMHDSLEGVCAYDLALILNQFVDVEKICTLFELNSRIRGFSYGVNDERNKPEEIHDSNLRSNRMKMTAAGMLCLMRHIRFIFGSLVDSDNPYWEILVKLKRILDILTANYHAKGIHDLLGVLVSEYMEMHSGLFQIKFNPKHHFLLHYARIMESVGPLWKICSMQFESKHQEGKKVSRSSLSRINMVHSIAINHHMRMNFRLISSQKDWFNDLIDGIGQTKLIAIENMDFARDSSPVAQLSKSDGHINVCKFMNYFGSTLQNAAVIMLPSEEGPIYCVINSIILNEGKIKLVMKKMNECLFDNNF